MARSEAQVTSSKHSEAHIKLTRVFRYLQALNLRRNPPKRDIGSQPWLLWFHDLPNHPCIRIGTVPTKGEDVEDHDNNVATESMEGRDTSTAENFILKVKRPRLIPPPEPPTELIDWLQPGWQRFNGTVAVKPTGSIMNRTTGEFVKFEDDPRRQSLLETWVAQRNRWLETERAAYQTMAVFEKLYALQAELEREAERLELMLGNGLLDWHPLTGSSVHHPILLQRLQLEFDPTIPEFTLIEADRPPELYTALFPAISDVSAATISKLRDDLDRGEWHPLGGDETRNFLQRVVTQLSPYGQLLDEAPSRKIDQHIPTMMLDPVIFLRSRTLGFSIALESILEDLPHRDTLPDSLQRIVGIEHNTSHEQAEPEATTSLLTSPNGEDEHILLSKAANAEQLEIARKLEREGAVLVQGPPGTGKTHTIANLIGHLLAQGKSVLVTSHTAKALTVLKKQVVEPLQPLCVSVLNDSSSNKELEGTIDAITERLATDHPDTLEREAARLTRHRLDLLSRLREARRQLSAARYDEYSEIVIAGKQYTPAQAAREIAANRETASWIPTPVKSSLPLPLFTNELVELYTSNRTVTANDEKEMQNALPEPASLLPPLDFARIVEEQTQLQKEQLDYRRDLWHLLPRNPAICAEPLNLLQERIDDAVKLLRNAAPWQIAAIEAGREGGSWRQVWDDLIADIQNTLALAARTQPLLFRYNPTIREDCLPGKTGKVLDEILAHGGKLSKLTLLMHPDWKTLIAGSQVLGQAPELPEHFEALRMMLHLQVARQNLLSRWQRQMVPCGGPAIPMPAIEPEKICARFIQPLHECLDWFSTIWLPLERELVQQGFQWKVFFAEIPVNLTTYGELLRLQTAVVERLPLLLKAEIQRRTFAANERKLQSIRQYLETVGGGSAGRAEITELLLTALNTGNVMAYAQAFQHLNDLFSQRKDLQRRYSLLAKLEMAAPAWAAAIRHREGVHGKSELPGDPEKAWLWRQLYDELERRASTSLEEIQERIAHLSAELQRTTAELVEKKAWAAQVRRTTLEQRQALQGWKALMKRIGKGTGKRAPRLRAKARELIPMCQSAVPVWIMPLSRVVENFNPRHTHFDVVIIDEASQSDALALTAIYMGKQVIVVGDDEQVSPIAIGQDISETTYLIDEYLKGIPNAELYDGKLSIYDLAKASFAPICLREHFRCVSPIIQFSNHLSYHGKIKPLRDDSEVHRQPPTVAYHVQSTVLKGEINEEEVQTVASLLVAATQQPEYRDATFGVISMLSEDQTILRIDELLRRHLPAEEYVRRRVQCGNAGQFQGDERDVIFLALLDAPTGSGPLPLREFGPDDRYKKRFNVAASRARDQLWVIHSMNPDIDLKPNDIRRRLIEHARDPLAFTRELQVQEQRTDSEFERLVLRRLMQAGYRVTPQWPVGAYRIDLVVEGGGKRLAIECDGDRWHPQEKLEEDMARQAILERLGWRFVRIRGSQFFRDPDKAMQAVFARLSALEIPAEGVLSTQLTAPSKAQAGEELKARIIRRAAELRQQWATQREEIPIAPVHSRVQAEKTPVAQAYRTQATDYRHSRNQGAVNQKAAPVSNNQPVVSNVQMQSSVLPNDLPGLIASLEKSGLTVIDRRDRQGGIWVVGGNELSSLMQSLATKGFHFKFYSRGVVSTRGSKNTYLDGWHMKSAR